ncbi:MAG: alkaline phosphatase family protein [Armatimonadetes bacterium]|nr:alkaline phosphatase family protein [Armatimonadota bacterium]
MRTITVPSKAGRDTSLRQNLSRRRSMGPGSLREVPSLQERVSAAPYGAATMVKCLRVCDMVLLLLLLTGLCAGAEAPRPRLVVLVVIDQMRQDYLTRFGDLLLPPETEGRPGGFRYLRERGAEHAQCYYEHHPTHTAVGHATLVTGAWPGAHGIVANNWYETAAGKKVYAAEDPQARMVGVEGERPAASPKQLACGTLADELKLASLGSSLVYSISVNDRAAVLSGGYSADLALWFDMDTGRWVSSTHYGSVLPPWVQEINRSGWAEKRFGALWRPLLPDAMAGRTHSPDQPGRARNHLGLGPEFPHPITGGESSPGRAFFEALTVSPLGNEFTLDVAAALLESEPLGQDEFPDLLVVSLSANDKIGHAYGPYSPEVLDITVRTDRELAEFFELLQRKVGLQNVLLAIASDHGVAPLPEEARQLGLPGERIDEKELKARVEAALARRFGPAQGYVAAFTHPHLYLDRNLLKSSDLEDARQIAADAAAGVPGVMAAYTADSLMEGEHRSDPVALALSQSYYPGRSGDVILVRQSFRLYGSGRAEGTNHGEPWSYDTHVPLLLAGPGVPRGRFNTRCSPRDLAPTLCDILGITPPSGSSGRVLYER